MNDKTKVVLKDADADEVITVRFFPTLLAAQNWADLATDVENGVVAEVV